MIPEIQSPCLRLINLTRAKWATSEGPLLAQPTLHRFLALLDRSRFSSPWASTSRLFCADDARSAEAAGKVTDEGLLRYERRRRGARRAWLTCRLQTSDRATKDDASSGAVQGAREVVPMQHVRRGFGRRKVEEELCYAASEACFEGEAFPSKAVSVLGIAGVSLAASTGGSPADMPFGVFGGADCRIGSGYTLAE